MRVIMHGCNGRMGQTITRLISQAPDAEIVCGIDREPDRVKNSYPVYESFQEVTEEADVLIDFSYHTCIHDVLSFGMSKNMPLVICTTGFTPEEKQKMSDASKSISILHSANMSIGINLVLSLAQQAAEALFGDYDIEIVERHHNQKLDAPSGTALMIADAINSSIENKGEYVFERASVRRKRKPEEIGIHAVRGGTIVGDHDVIFAGPDEIIEINHRALSRDIFGHGAIKAARFIKEQQPGFYSLKDVIS
jgi:4-hydroxy-tetrahydrodipicolinate reductase